MFITHISDTHNKHDRLRPETGDLLCHTGDFSGFGYRHEVESFFSWLEQKAKLYTYGALVIAGNHDRSFDPKYVREYEKSPIDGEKPKWVEDLIISLPDRGITYIENETVEIGELKFWGGPVTPWFFGDTWAFNKHRHEIGECWRSIPDGIDVLLTHGPPKHKQDWVVRGMEYVGCESLHRRVQEVRPKLHLFGHVHESFGWCYDEYTTYVNSSYMNLNHTGTNGYHVIDTDQDMITPIKK